MSHDVNSEYIVNGKPATEKDLLKAALQVKNKKIVFNVNGSLYTAQYILEHAKMVDKVKFVECVVFIVSIAWSFSFFILFKNCFLFSMIESSVFAGIVFVYFCWRKKIGYKRYLGVHDYHESNNSKPT